MMRTHMLSLALVAMAVSQSGAQACALASYPTTAQHVASSDLIFVARVDEEPSVDSSGGGVKITIRRFLKGGPMSIERVVAPVWNCSGSAFHAKSEYLIFASFPATSTEPVRPNLLGSISLQEDGGQAELKATESILQDKQT